MTDGSQQPPDAPGTPDQMGVPPGAPEPPAATPPPSAPGAPAPPPSSAPTTPAPAAPAMGAPPPGAPTPPPGSRAEAEAEAPPKGAPPPGMPLLDSTEPEVKKKRVWPKVLAGLVLLILLLAGGCTFVLFQAAQGPVDEATEFLGAVRDGRTAEAVESIAPQCQPSDPSAVIDELNALGITDFSMGSPTINAQSGEATRGSSSGTVDTAAGTVEARFDVRRVDGDWRSCEIRIGSFSTP